MFAPSKNYLISSTPPTFPHGSANSSFSNIYPIPFENCYWVWRCQHSRQNILLHKFFSINHFKISLIYEICTWWWTKPYTRFNRTPHCGDKWLWSSKRSLPIESRIYSERENVCWATGNEQIDRTSGELSKIINTGPVGEMCCVIPQSQVLFHKWESIDPRKCYFLT